MAVRSIKVYNTLSRQKEEFKPLNPKLVSFYQCGSTVYWTQHIGNIRAVVIADFFRRSLNYLGYPTKFVRNYTDVGHLASDEDEGEDKMEKGAKRENKSPQEIADKYIQIFEQDIKAVNALDPDVKPRATEHIAEMIEMIQTLMAKDFAYATPLAIYFDVTKAKNYTRLSGQDLDKNISEAGSGDVSDPAKKHPIDFALWFFKAGVHEKALQTWPSPFESPLAKNGEGFPGWHIECSAMSKKYLGTTLDLHMGGIEHVPVHHTNEIAQSESANGQKFVNYWLHNEHLNVNDKKMSKSEGTAYSITEIKEKGFDPLSLRFFFLQAHYRSKQNFTWEALTASQTGLNNLRQKLTELNQTKEEGIVAPEFKEKFESYISDDFNSPQALALISEVLKSPTLPDQDKLATILNFDKVLGLNLENSLETAKIPSEIEALAKEREQARQAKNWPKSDEIRQKLTELGYEIIDTTTGPKVRKI